MDSNARILIVDDDESLAGFITELLKNFGYQVTTMHNSKQALEHFLQSDNSYDLIITDQTMPGMTGVEMASTILQQYPDQPIILCTGYSDDVDAKRAEEIGIKSFLEKPMETRNILSEITRLLEKK